MLYFNNGVRMYKVIVYEDRKGCSEIEILIDELTKKSKTSKESRIRLEKIIHYIDVLAMYGTKVGEPYIKHITNTELWELRPTRDRIFFVHLQGDIFILLHHFVKKTQKTPKKEIEKAKKNLQDHNERG